MKMETIKLLINIKNQTLEVLKGGVLWKTYSVSTAKRGVGEIFGSFCTPRGLHYIRAKIGIDAPLNTLFVKRRPTGEIFTPELARAFPERDWILTRILWLCGLEVGKNRLGKVDTMQRKIYIHGSPDDSVMGNPSSQGCIRMRNQDIIEVYNLASIGTQVQINE
jgi:L,D-transpeptidase YbiS